MKIANYKLLLTLEFIIFFIGVPMFLYLNKSLKYPSSILLPVLAIVIWLLVINKEFKFRELIYFKVPRAEIRKHMLIVLIIGIFLFAGTYLFSRETLFDLPKGNPFIWMMLCIFYPVFSAYLQEILFRTFLFRRYQPLFENNWALIIASGIVFGYAHILFYSAVSIILSLFGGIYFAYVYHKTKSVLFATIIHGILGIMIFTIGLGRYFWMDMYQWF